jgi:hypothetical protein
MISKRCTKVLPVITLALSGCRAGVASHTDVPGQLPSLPQRDESPTGVKLTLSVKPERGYDEHGWPKVYATFSVKPNSVHIYWLNKSVGPYTTRLQLLDQDNHVISSACSVSSNDPAWLYIALAGEDTLTQDVPLSCYHTDEAKELTITATYRNPDCNKSYAVPTPRGLTPFCGPIVSNIVILRKSSKNAPSQP